MISKGDIVQLANVIRQFPNDIIHKSDLTRSIADFLAANNPNFQRDRFYGYVNGKCGPDGGKR